MCHHDGRPIHLPPLQTCGCLIVPTSALTILFLGVLMLSCFSCRGLKDSNVQRVESRQIIPEKTEAKDSEKLIEEPPRRQEWRRRKTGTYLQFYYVIKVQKHTYVLLEHFCCRSAQCYFCIWSGPCNSKSSQSTCYNSRGS